MTAKYVLAPQGVTKKLMQQARQDANRMGYTTFIEANLVTKALAENEANKRGLTIHVLKAAYPKDKANV